MIYKSYAGLVMKGFTNDIRSESRFIVRWPAGVCRVGADRAGGVMKNFIFWMTWATVILVLGALLFLSWKMLPFGLLVNEIL